MLRRAAEAVLALDEDELKQRREKERKHWVERKAVLGPIWDKGFQRLPWHVQRVLGRGKNLLLLAEMLQAAGSPDALLIEDLKEGFALVGELIRSGTLEAVPYPRRERTEVDLRQGAQRRNADMWRRVQHCRAAEPSVERAVAEGSEAEVKAGKGRWCDPEQVGRRAVLTPRFGVDEGMRVKKGKWARKVRVIDDFVASLVSSA